MPKELSQISKLPAEVSGPIGVKVESLQDGIILDTTKPRVKKGDTAVLPKDVAEHLARCGQVKIL